MKMTRKMRMLRNLTTALSALLTSGCVTPAGLMQDGTPDTKASNKPVAEAAQCVTRNADNARLGRTLGLTYPASVRTQSDGSVEIVYAPTGDTLFVATVSRAAQGSTIRVWRGNFVTVSVFETLVEGC
jgi:starvation-inducible outer membrane lipoprotein